MTGQNHYFRCTSGTRLLDAESWIAVGNIQIYESPGARKEWIEALEYA